MKPTEHLASLISRRLRTCRAPHACVRMTLRYVPSLCLVCVCHDYLWLVCVCTCVYVCHHSLCRRVTQCSSPRRARMGLCVCVCVCHDSLCHRVSCRQRKPHSTPSPPVCAAHTRDPRGVRVRAAGRRDPVMTQPAGETHIHTHTHTHTGFVMPTRACSLLVTQRAPSSPICVCVCVCVLTSLNASSIN